MSSPQCGLRPFSESSSVSSYDLPTRDKIPVIREILATKEEGLALDIGIGTGYTTFSVFEDRPTACVDLHAPNLIYYRGRLTMGGMRHKPLCVIAHATALPFKSESFRYVLCSEVLEHLENDAVAAREIARVLRSDGKAVITVPYTGLGFTTFLELLRIKTVHDYPGPEQHVRRGYTENSLQALVGPFGLSIQCHAHYLRLFTRVVTDLQSMAHLIYQRVAHRRKVWTWSEIAASETSLAFRIYRFVFPICYAVTRLDKLLARFRGFGLVALVVKNKGGES